ncbi:MAG: hydrogenobyrinic/cobyrinic acid a,c-diamide synthase [Coriobacteriia bacterium]|nr:hydrogenobyrinic/cobyrinic acid a,c-diamide synthase [Coriobacteriia bacterium]
MTARLVIAAPATRQGKTSVVLGLASALRENGLAVAVCKVGPDYLDTRWHALATGRMARNLDVWTMGERGVAQAFSRSAHEADIVLIEGVMGLFDGHRTGAAPTSTAGVAALLGAPVVLVIDASHSDASLAALAGGFATFDPSVRVAGVVLNRFAEHRERSAVKQAFKRVGIPVLGWLPPSKDAELPSRHLGLVQPFVGAGGAGGGEGGAADGEGIGDDGSRLRRSKEAIDALAHLVKCHADVQALLQIARAAGPWEQAPCAWEGWRQDDGLDGGTDDGSVGDIGSGGGAVCDAAVNRRVRIAVAADEAFSFYYPDSLDVLRGFGAELVWFSPIRDGGLPQGVSGIYLGGGYPELFARQLAENHAMRESVADAASDGTPIYAECGGMLYLLDALLDSEGRCHDMAGVLPGRARMAERLQRVGYVEARLASDGILGDAGAVVRGHEHRYSVCEPAQGETPAWLVGGKGHGFATANVLASYLHLNFVGCPARAEAFLGACREYGRGAHGA